MRLHRTTRAAIGLTSGGMSFCEGLLDKTETLNLITRDGKWCVTVQSNGYRLIGYRTMTNARKYMEYMLEHAQEILLKMPLEYEDARVYAGAHLWCIHHDARAWVDGSGT